MSGLSGGKQVLALSASQDQFPVLSEWLEGLLSGWDFPVPETQKLLISADEIFTNIASYAYPSGIGSVSIEAEYNAAGKSVTLSFTDHGIPFDPLRAVPPDVTVPVSERQIGGLGIMVVRKLMDSAIYRREGESNILVLTKSVEKGRKTC